MLALLVLAAATTTAPERVAEAAHAIAVGRLDQAKSMIAAAIGDGARGEPIDRLLADLAFATYNDGEALARYKALLEQHPNDSQLLERATMSAVRLYDMAEAKMLANRATLLPAPSWRAWNARGVISDLEGDFDAADVSYRRALALAPDQPEVHNNIGWSRLLRGDWEGAIEPLERAISLMPKTRRATNNLELARMALANDLPRRRPGESENAWAGRLNDVGVAAQLRGERARAIAAFSRAIEAHGSWYERAANNLRAADGYK